MRIVVIGATGHIGTYLIPQLLNDGHEVVAVSRGKSQPYHHHGAWKAVQTVAMDRAASERDGQFGESIKRLKPDVVIDLICFTLDSAKQLATALMGHVQHILHCGTIWVHGPSVEVPTTEAQTRRPFGDYGIQKAQIESFLLEEARLGRLPATVLHPGHIVGPGWAPLNPAGHFDVSVFERLAFGEKLTLPNFGLETVHHVHADDVAQAFLQAVRNWNSAVGESFHVVSPKAVTLRGYAEAVANWFGQTAELEFLPWDEWTKTVTSEQAAATWDHIAHSPNCSIEKAQRCLGYLPRYTSLEAVYEAVQWLASQGKIRIP